MATVTGPSHRLTTCNAAYRALVDRPAGLIGTVPQDRWPRPEAQELVELLDHVGRTGQSEKIGEWCACLDLDGSGRPVELYLDLTATPCLTAHGAVEGVHLALVDATDRVVARQRAARRRRETGPPASGVDVVATLQSELLPVALPVLADADIAAAYLLSPDSTRAGGDWFDCIVRPDGTVALVVGDVVGGGVGAVAVMSQLRAVLGDHLLAGTTLHEAVRRLDRCAAARAESRAATVCVVVLDLGSGDVEYCTAGHPPPLVIAAATGSRSLALSGSAPLGIGGVPQVRSDHLDLGDVLVMYTDGILGRPRLSHLASYRELQRVLEGAVSDGGVASVSAPRATMRATAAAIERAHVAGYVDDIVLLAAERVGPPAGFVIQQHAHPDTVAAVRDALARWLEPLEADVVDVTAVQHAVGELVTNAVEHSGGLGPDAVTVSASLTPEGALVCTVADTGRWRAQDPAPLDRGHGLAMVRGLVDRLDLASTDGGTSAVLHHRLHRPAQLLSATLVTTTPSGADEDPAPFAVETDGDHVRVRGSLDLRSADELRILLQRAAHSAREGLVVDMSGVTHLGSAGVQVLHELLDDTTVRLAVPAGTTVERVLEVVRLPYDRLPPA
jgi:anti-anti-sigma factor